MRRFEGRAGLITAAGSGMGRAGAVRLGSEGARVAVVDRDGGEAERTVEAVREAGGEAHAIAADLRDLERAGAIVAEAVAALGPLAFVWNHLGHPGPSKVEGMDPADLELALDLNVKSAIATTAAALPTLRETKGALLFTASTAGVIGSRYSPVYSAVKHAIVGFTKALALRHAAEGIRVNVLCPGPIDTPMFKDFGSRTDQAQRTREEVEAATVQVVPMRRLGTAPEAAAAAAFLLSDDASYVTGATLAVDGGYTAQ